MARITTGTRSYSIQSRRPGAHRVLFRENGIQASSGTFPTNKKAELFATTFMKHGKDVALARFPRERGPRTQAPTLLEALTKMYEVKVNAGAVQGSTAHKALKTVTLYIPPEILNQQLSDITTGDLQEVHDQLCRQETVHSKRQRQSAHRKGASIPEQRFLSAKTIKNVFNVLNSAFMYASTHLSFGGPNPIAPVLMRPVRTPEPYIFTTVEWHQFYEALDDHYKLLGRFMFETGVRFGEAAALRIRDLEQETSRFHVKVALKATADLKGYEIGTPKTERSKRWVTISKELMSDLEKSIEDRKHDLDAPVFLSLRGRWLRNDRVIKVFRAALEEAGMSHIRITPHVLRHAHITYLIENGQDLLNTARRVGHSNISMIGQRYGHRSESVDAKSAEIIADITSGRSKIPQVLLTDGAPS